MSITITGVVRNGVVVPKAPLPEGAEVEIRLSEVPAADSGGPSDAGRVAADAA